MFVLAILSLLFVIGLIRKINFCVLLGSSKINTNSKNSNEKQHQKSTYCIEYQYINSTQATTSITIIYVLFYDFNVTF